MAGKWMPLSQHNKIVAEIIAERDRAIRERTMAERNNDILVRIREAKRGPLDKYVEWVLDDAEAEIEAARLAAERDTPRTERDEAVALLREARPWVCWCRDTIRRTDDPEDVKRHANAMLDSIDAFFSKLEEP